MLLSMAQQQTRMSETADWRHVLGSRQTCAQPHRVLAVVAAGAAAVSGTVKLYASRQAYQRVSCVVQCRLCTGQMYSNVRYTI
jgi:hypothetical protein